ncbi:MAG: response regulator [Ktedonobacterales bacterium]
MLLTLDGILTDPPYLPRLSLGSHALAADGDDAVHPETRVHTLVVDDDADLRLSLRFLLESEGYSVDEARDGGEALAYLRDHTEPIVVLLDLMMPRVDGTAMLQAVAADPQLAQRNAYVIVTANRERLPLEMSPLLARLRVPIVTKPYDLDKMLGVIARSAGRLRDESSGERH